MTSSIFMPSSLADAVPDLICMLSNMALIAAYKCGKQYASLVIVLSNLDFRLSTAKLWGSLQMFTPSSSNSKVNSL